MTREKAGRFTLRINGKAELLLGGELHNSSAASVSQIQTRFAQLKALHLNCVLAPVSWELIEPQEGRFDWTLVDALVTHAREQSLYLVPLWFGTMKNAISCYTPTWVKRDLKRFFRAQEKPGVNSWTVSVFCEEVLRCDVRAFVALMERIKQLDPDGSTVPMVQVENEPGMLNARRDMCPAALQAFAQPVPDELFTTLVQREAELHPELQQSWRESGRHTQGSWSQVFGTMADEAFMAWHVARFVDHVAAAGKRVHPLLMFANAWLHGGPGYEPGMYPSGGPVARVLDIWRCAGPHLDAIAPDIYTPMFRENCAAYARGGFPLLIPEAKNDDAAAARGLYAIGQHGAILFSPFGIDDLRAEQSPPLASLYRLISDMHPLLIDAVNQGRTVAFLQQNADDDKFESILAGYRFRARKRQPLDKCRVPGCLMLMQVGEDEFVAVGQNMILTFEPADVSMRVAEILWQDVGTFSRGQWKPSHRLNGDETAHGTGVILSEAQTCVRFALHAYS